MLAHDIYRTTIVQKTVNLQKNSLSFDFLHLDQVSNSSSSSIQFNTTVNSYLSIRTENYY